MKSKVYLKRNLQNCKNAPLKLVFLLIFLVASTSVFAQEILSQPVVEKLSSAVFEVVVKKPAEGNITYERDLPLERISFTERNDPYFSIGTAFLMEDGNFYSASHVFQLMGESLYKEYFIRDRNGKTFPIDKIINFATNRDFIIFSVKNFDTKNAVKLKKQNSIAINSQVYSVGNALGQGIVIRDGILTSLTFEDYKGEWKWIRFSAAASPGNSGGPLIDENGNVLGIVTMKSQNENLNYALPMEETTKTPKNVGILFQPSYYTVPNIATQKFYSIYEGEIPLPDTLKGVQEKVISKMSNQVDNFFVDIKKEYNPLGEKGFAYKEGDQNIFSNFYSPSFPAIICLAENNEWGIYTTNDVKDSKIPNSTTGSVSRGTMLRYAINYISKPDDVSLESLLKNPKQYLDYAIYAMGLTRTVAGEKIRITSFGEPIKSETHIDRNNRKWFINFWEIPFGDSICQTFALPVPSGIVLFVSIDTTSDAYNGDYDDLKFITDYVYPRYTGTIKDWNEFLSLPDSLYPKYEPFDSLKIEQTSSGLNLSSKEFNIPIEKNMMNLSDDSRLSCIIGFTQEKDSSNNTLKLNSEFYGINISTKAKEEKYSSLFVGKMKKPSENSPKASKENWEQKTKRIEPFNAKAYDSGDYTYYESIFASPKETEKELNAKDFLFFMSLQMRNTTKKKIVNDLGKKLFKIITFK